MKKWLKVFIVALASSIVFCFGCTIHETNRWDKPQDFITHLLALGTYFSLLVAFPAAAAFVARCSPHSPTEHEIASITRPQCFVIANFSPTG